MTPVVRDPPPRDAADANPGVALHRCGNSDGRIARQGSRGSDAEDGPAESASMTTPAQ
jgi:hypothetical protein